MVKNYEELNSLEREGLVQILLKEGWTPCTLHSPDDKIGSRQAMTKRMSSWSKQKDITVELKDFHVDED